MVFWVNRKKFILLSIGVILAAAVFLSARAFSPNKVESGVKFCGTLLDPYTINEVEELVAAKIGEWQIDPVEAVFYPGEETVVPELWGYTTDVHATILKIKNATSGEHVFPAFQPILPEVKAEDYPWAVIRRGNPHKQQISFMINVAWGEEHLYPMLDLFEETGVEATFYVVGSWAEKNRTLLQTIAQKGHTIGNHGHTDAVTYPQLAPDEIRSGLLEVNELVRDATGQVVRYFTPHKGEYNRTVLEIVLREGMRTLLWSVDTVDWMEPGAETMKNKMLENLHPGAIILMHPTADTVVFLEATVPRILEKGYEIVTVEELLNPDHPPLEYFQ